jgi:transcriptional regulator with XRE-family HTH domain
MIISERIFKRLEELGMSQKEFAEQTGITPSTISDWKRKKTNPASDKLMVICKALKITPNELLSGTSDTQNKWDVEYMLVDEKSDDYILLEQYHNLDVRSQERLMGYLLALSQQDGDK